MEPILLYLTYVICVIAFTGDLGSIYFINHLWSYRKHKFIQSRSPTLTYSVLWIFFSFLLLAITNAFIYIFVDVWDATYFFIINDFIQYGSTFAYATRAWILFYHVQWSYESVNHVWRTQLADVKEVEALQSTSVDNSFSDASLFWINYRDSLGNWKKVFPMTMGVLLPLFIFLTDILPFIVFRNKTNQRGTILILRGVNILCYLVVFVLILILIRRIHKISDKYGIAQELKRINLCFALFIVIGRVLNMILVVSVDKHNEIDAIVTFIAGSCSILSILCSLYIASFSVLRKLITGYAGGDTLKHLEAYNKSLHGIVSICSCGFESTQAIETNTGHKPQKVTLNRVLSTQYGFETFTQFLISELSVENILFLVEVKQYKACCRRYHKAERTPLAIDSQKDVIEIMSLTEKKPKFDPKMVASLRPTTTTRSKPNVFQSKAIMTVDYVPSNAMLQSLEPYDYALYLYHKYVIDGSDLQINIPSKTLKMLRKFLITTGKSNVILLDDYTDKMFKLYDKAWEQINTLITSDSYSRFRNTQEFKELCVRMKDDDVKLQLDVSNQVSSSGQSVPNEFLIQPTPSLLDWEYTETVMVNSNRMSLNKTSSAPIPEDAEVDVSEEEEDVNDNIEEDDCMEEEFEKLNSIQEYGVDAQKGDTMRVLEDIEEIL